MSAHPHPTDEERSLEDGDHTQIISDIVKEFKHTDFGVWDVYEHIPHRRFGVDAHGMPTLPHHVGVIEDLPFVWRAVKDVIKTGPCLYHLSLFILVKFLASLIPAVELWYV